MQIINFCPTGMVPTKRMTKEVPVTTLEIIEQVHQAYEIGISIVHLHARDENEEADYKKNNYSRIFEGVRKYCPELIICGSSSGRTFPEFEKRSEVLELKPDMCSLTLSSVNFLNQSSINTPDMIVRLAEKMNEYGVIPELECFDMGMINYGNYLIKKGILKGPYYWNLLFGNIAGMQANLNQVQGAISSIPKGHLISFAGIGSDQLKINALAVALGYGVRVGLEDNIWFDRKRTKLASNLELVKRIHQLMEIHELELFTSSKLRALGFSNKG